MKSSSTRTELRRIAPLAFALLAAGAHGLELAGACRVLDDASLVVGGETLVLAHIRIPLSAADCASLALAPGCGAPAAPALRARARGTVRCTPPAGAGLAAVCRLDEPAYATGLDLGAWLVEQGWALPLPDAPFEYHVLERLARETGRGLFGGGAGGALLPRASSPVAPPGP